MLKAILFDMDGLIFDTESVYKQSWQYAATEQHLTISDGFYQQFIGVQDPDCERLLVKHFQSALDIERYRTTRDAHYQQLRQQGIAIKPGFAALLAFIKQRGLRTALVTSSPLVDVKFNFSPTDYLSQFELVISAEDVVRSKPHPEGYQKACKRLGLAPDECLVLEDSNNGIRAALTAGCHAVMIPDLLPPLPEWQDRIIQLDNLHQVIEILDSFS
ncbi:haloacid dehalogenase [Vibrio galatheae]|uniref:Haloacid dehalogenase n=1 Tax=Vibrio galatheae TaxID=579748 RepID=A0A0F4NK45_9VIBR|nr:HAD family phosphatase [Vibrio galatheae]KJY83565.1 haloacid dehalogenase [Vibrio galatheae]